MIFANLLNGVPMEQICKDYNRSESEVMNIFSFVLRKVKSYCFERSATKDALPMITAATLDEAKKHRLTCLTVLPKLNLNKDPKYRDIQIENVTPDNLMSIGSKLNT